MPMGIFVAAAAACHAQGIAAENARKLLRENDFVFIPRILTGKARMAKLLPISAKVPMAVRCPTSIILRAVEDRFFMLRAILR